MRRPDHSIRAVSSICSTQTTMSLFVSRLAWIAAPRVHGTPPCSSACADYVASTDRPITLGVCPSDKPNSRDSITRLRRSQLIGGLGCPQQFACPCQLIRSACLSRHDFPPVRIMAISLPRACSACADRTLTTKQAIFPAPSKRTRKLRAQALRRPLVWQQFRQWIGEFVHAAHGKVGAESDFLALGALSEPLLVHGERVARKRHQARIENA